MASAWGSAWAAAWGNSWGSIASDSGDGSPGVPGRGIAQVLPRRQRRREDYDDVENDVRRAYARATGEDTEAAQTAAAQEIAQIAQAALGHGDAQVAALAQQLQQLQELESTASRYLQAVGEIIAMQKQHSDDLEAFILIANLA